MPRRPALAEAALRSGGAGQWNDRLDDAELAAYAGVLRSPADPAVADRVEDATRGS